MAIVAPGFPTLPLPRQKNIGGSNTPLENITCNPAVIDSW